MRALAVLVFSASPALAAFDDAPFGARDAAMGGAFMAVHDEVGALAYNPAALGRVPSVEAAASYQNGPHWPAGTIDRDISRAAAAVPVRQEIFNGAFGFDMRYDRRVGLAKDRLIGLYYGTRGLFETEKGGVDLGVGLKTMQSSLEAGGSTGLKPALDLGGLWRLGDERSLGASLRNFGGADFKGSGYSDRAPLALRVGAAEAVHGSLLCVDAAWREPSSGQRGSVGFAAGFERWWPTPRAGSFAARSGLLLGGLSKNWSWGFGWRIEGARLDYAMTVPLTGVTRFGHSLSLSARFGRSDPEAEYARLLEGEMKARRDLSRALDAGSVKQHALSEEIGRMREEISALRSSLAGKRQSEDEARRKLQELEGRHKKAVESFRRLQDEHAQNAARTKEELFREDWESYKKAKLDGTADAALLERLRRLLVEYKDANVDLGEANRELGRLQQSR